MTIQQEVQQRRRAWAVMQELGSFTPVDIQTRVAIENAILVRLIGSLKGEGVLRPVHEGFHPAPGERRYELTDPEATPEVIADPPELKPLQWRQQVWNAIRIMRRFTIFEIRMTLTVEISKPSVSAYLRNLRKAGLIRKAGRSAPANEPMSLAVYQLVRDEGPTAPRVNASTAQVKRGEVSA